MKRFIISSMIVFAIIASTGAMSQSKKGNFATTSNTSQRATTTETNFGMVRGTTGRSISLSKVTHQYGTVVRTHTYAPDEYNGILVDMSLEEATRLRDMLNEALSE